MGQSKNVFVVGGAGFLGYHTCWELLNRNWTVTCLALPDEAVDEDLVTRVNLARADIDELTDEELAKMLAGHDSLVYAAGPDDRVELPAGIKATDFFQAQLVERTERVLRIAKTQGIKKAIIFGSYFSYINDHGLAGLKKGSLERHPYIKARVDQSERSFALGDEDFVVVVLNIPYVFGTAPGKEPIWRKVFIEKYADSPKIFYGKGGTTVISAKKIAYATAQALEEVGQGAELAIGSKNMKFKPMIERLLSSAGVNKKVGNLPNWLMNMIMRQQWKKSQRANMDFGLDLRYLNNDIMKRDFYVDFMATDIRLGMENYQDDVLATIDETGEFLRKNQG